MRFPLETLRSLQRVPQFLYMHRFIAIDPALRGLSFVERSNPIKLFVGPNLQSFTSVDSEFYKWAFHKRKCFIPSAFANLLGKVMRYFRHRDTLTLTNYNFFLRFLRFYLANTRHHLGVQKLSEKGFNKSPPKVLDNEIWQIFGAAEKSSLSVFLSSESNSFSLAWPPVATHALWSLLLRNAKTG
jgi:hypothetical protein